MCGLFGGFSTSLVKGEMDFITTLGFISSLRGVDSTGVVVGYHQKKTRAYSIVKDTIASPEFFSTATAGKALGVDGRFLVIGHARAATVGDVTVDNAHPHRAGPILGAHNGTIHALAKRGYSSDSKAMFHLIAEKGLQEAVDAAGFGAYALSWVDTSKRTLNFLRNDQRPLFYAFQKHGRTLYWASEPEMLKFASKRTKMEIFEPVAFQENQLHTLPTDASSFDFTVTPIKKTQPVSTAPTQGRHFGTSGSSSSNRSLVKYSSGVRYVKNDVGVWVPEEFEPKSATPDTDEGTYRIGKVVKPFKQVEGLLKRGCFLCSRVPDIKVEQTHWVSHTDYACNTCKRNDTGRMLSTLSLYKRHISVGYYYPSSTSAITPILH